MTTGAAAAKSALRADIRAARARRTEAERAAAGDSLRDVVLALPELAVAEVVAAYVDSAGEPPTRPLLAALSARDGVRVLLPVQRADGELDWCWYAGPDALRPGPYGISEPTGTPLGQTAIGEAQLLVVPALAVDHRGGRLGQGGGGYDRALRCADPATLTVALIYDDELRDIVPTESHDVAVGAAATPSGLQRLTGA